MNPGTVNSPEVQVYNFHLNAFFRSAGILPALFTEKSML
jgi:hypothetical protein